MRTTLLMLMLLPQVRAEELQRHEFSEPHMGTRFRIIIYATSAESATKASKAAYQRIANLNGIMSDYDRSSELMKLCAEPTGKPVRISEELFHVLSHAQALAEESEGAFDVTVGPVSRLWRRVRKRSRLPSARELEEARAPVGHQHLKLDPKDRTARLMKKDMQLDLGGIAKGYAADEAIRILKKHGIKSALVAAGGDIVVSDPPPKEKGWKVGIAPLTDPEGKPQHYLLLSNAAVSTSGDAEQYTELGGKRYSHIADPRTGLGVMGQFSVTVLAPRGIETDSLATAVSVLGSEKGMKLIEKRAKTEVMIIRKINEKKRMTRSEGFEKYLIAPKDS